MQINIKHRYTRAKGYVEERVTKLLQWVEKHRMRCFWLLGIFYKLVLDYTYIFVASPSYAYAGLVLDLNAYKYLLSTLIYLLMFSLLPKKETDAVAFLLHLQFVLTVAPMLTFYALGNQNTTYMIMVCVCVVLQLLLLRGEAKPERACYIKDASSYMTVLLGIMVFATVLVTLLNNGFEGLKAFDFVYIYEMRENISYFPGFAYLLGWVTKTILPFFVLWTLQKKQYKICVALLAIELLFFLLTGEKFLLFVILPIIGIYVLSKTKHLVKLMYTGLIIGFLVLMMVYYFMKSTTLGLWIPQLVFVRTIFHPADNKFNFYECFSELPKIHFSDGIIGKMFGLTYPYAGSSGQVVYAHMGGKFLSANMNTGYLGESYAQFGFFGMLLMSLVLAFFLRALRCYDNGERFSFITALFSVYIIILNDGALLTTLFSGGMLISLLLLMVYFKKDKEVLQNGIQRI